MLDLAPELADSSAPREHPPVYCLLQVNYNGSVSILARNGCTDADVRELLTILAAGLPVPHS